MISDLSELEGRLLYTTFFAEFSLLKKNNLPKKAFELKKDIEEYFKVSFKNKGQKVNTYLFLDKAGEIRLLFFEQVAGKKLEAELTYPIDYGGLSKKMVSKYNLVMEKGFDVKDYLPRI